MTEETTKPDPLTEEQQNLLAGVLELELKMFDGQDLEDEDQVKAFARHFREAGVVSLYIEFDGGGDSGCIESIAINGHEVQGKLYTLLEDWAYKLDGLTAHDWCNGDGGFGHIDFDIEKGTFECEVTQRITDHHLAYYEEIEI